MQNNIRTSRRYFLARGKKISWSNHSLSQKSHCGEIAFGCEKKFPRSHNVNILLVDPAFAAGLDPETHGGPPELGEVCRIMWASDKSVSRNLPHLAAVLSSERLYARRMRTRRQRRPSEVVGSLSFFFSSFRGFEIFINSCASVSLAEQLLFLCEV